MYRTYSNGIIEIITGPMFSGKSEELIKRIKILEFAKKKLLILKPKIDTRWNDEEINSRCGSKTIAFAVEKVTEIKELLTKDNYDVVIFDEIQFLETGVLDLIVSLANEGKNIIASGLDQDAFGQPFGVMPGLLAVADFVDKQHAVCVVCGNAATMTFKKTKNSTSQIEVGDSDIYEARCRRCHHQGMSQ